METMGHARKAKLSSWLKRFSAVLLFAIYSGLVFVLHEFEGTARTVMGMVTMVCAAVIISWLLKARSA